MNIGLDLLFLIPRETGGRETYARELLAAMLDIAPDLSATLFVNREAEPELKRTYGSNLAVVGLPTSPRRPGSWAVGEIALLPRAGRRAQVDVLHSLANFGPVTGAFRRVLTIHDLQYRAVPELLTWGRRVGTAALIGLAAQRATRLIAVSAFTAREVSVQLSVPRSRIDVIANGVGSTVCPTAPEAELRQRYGLGGRTVALSVSTALPHKNLPTLLEALALIPIDRRPLLVLVGAGTDSLELKGRADALGVATDTRLLGYQPSASLEGLYGLARCAVVPSLYEGFGFPVLEAMRRGVPVACSDIPALREVAGGAAALFSPHRAAEIAGAIEQLMTDAALARRHSESGRQQAARFSWTRTAEATLSCYRRVLSA